MNRLHNRLLCALLALFTLISLCSCGTKHENKGDATTAAIDRLLEAVANTDTEKYKSAFPPDYIEKLAAALPVINEDIDEKIKADMEQANEARELNFGEKSYVCYTLVSKSPLEASTLYGSYQDYYLEGYTLPENSVSEAFTAKVIISSGGTDRETDSEAVFTVLKIGETWYLHPKFFLYML